MSASEVLNLIEHCARLESKVANSQSPVSDNAQAPASQVVKAIARLRTEIPQLHAELEYLRARVTAESAECFRLRSIIAVREEHIEMLQSDLNRAAAASIPSPVIVRASLIRGTR
jgi:hypothetical protein